MEHTKKMVVVPQDLMENLRYNQRKQAGEDGRHELSVDREMKDILTRGDLTQDDKIRLYNNALLKFGDNQKPPKPESRGVEEPDNEWGDIIDKHFGLNNRGKAKNVLEWLQKRGNVTWNNRGEIVGHPGSNILTLLDDITRANPHSRSVVPIGMKEFTTKLLESNLPRYLISNYYQKKFLEDTDTESDFETPKAAATPKPKTPRTTRSKRPATLAPTTSPIATLLLENSPPNTPEKLMTWISQN